jgi:hypothetical protein
MDCILELKVIKQRETSEGYAHGTSFDLFLKSNQLPSHSHFHRELFLRRQIIEVFVNLAAEATYQQ